MESDKTISTEESITLVLKDKDYKIDKKIAEFSKVLAEADLSDKIPCEIEESILIKIDSFYKMYNYDKIVLQNEIALLELTSNNIHEVFPKKIIEYLECFIMDKNKPNLNAIKDFLMCCYAFDFLYLKDIILMLIQSKFYCPKTQDLEMYKNNWKMGKEINIEKYLRLTTEDYRFFFHDISLQLAEEFNKEYELLTEEQQKANKVAINNEEAEENEFEEDEDDD